MDKYVLNYIYYKRDDRKNGKTCADTSIYCKVKQTNDTWYVLFKSMECLTKVSNVNGVYSLISCDKLGIGGIVITIGDSSIFP